MCLVSVTEVLMLINISCEMETVLRYIYLILTLNYVNTPEDEGIASSQSQDNYTISKLDGRIFTISVLSLVSPKNPSLNITEISLRTSL